MFPEDGGEWNAGAKRADDDGDHEMGAADMIVMERARKRRKELEEEEREEEEILERQKARVEREPNERAIGKRKARGTQKTVAPRQKPKRLAARLKSPVVSDFEGVADRTRNARTTRAGSHLRSSSSNSSSSDESTRSSSGSSDAYSEEC
jgi:hypothetical protein